MWRCHSLSTVWSCVPHRGATLLGQFAVQRCHPCLLEQVRVLFRLAAGDFATQPPWFGHSFQRSRPEPVGARAGCPTPWGKRARTLACCLTWEQALPRCTPTLLRKCPLLFIRCVCCHAPFLSGFTRLRNRESSQPTTRDAARVMFGAFPLPFTTHPAHAPFSSLAILAPPCYPAMRILQRCVHRTLHAQSVVCCLGPVAARR